MKYLVTFLLLFSTFYIVSQNNISKKDKKTYNLFLDELQNGSLEKGIKLADSTYRIANKEDNKLLEILMLNILANGNLKKGNFILSNDFFTRSNNKIINMDDSYLKDSLLVNNFNEHSKAFLLSGNFTKAIKKNHESLVISKKNKDSLFIGYSYKWLGNAYAMQEFYDDAIFYYTECLKYDNSVKMKHDINSNLGNIYSINKEYAKAEKYLIETLKVTGQNNFENIVSYTSLANLYHEIKNYKKSHKHYLKADEYAAKNNNKIYQLESKTNLIKSFTNIKDYKSAKKYIQICDSLANIIDANSLKMNLYKEIYLSSAKMKDYKTAFEHAEKYIIVYDSIFNREKTKVVKDLKIKHESDLKETEILSQKKLIKTQKKQNTGLLIGLGIILISIVFLIILQKKRLTVQKKLLKKQEELAEEKMNTLLEKQKVKTFQSHIEGQNKERERIAKDLHDSVSGNLAAIKMRLSNLKVNNFDELNTLILNINETYNEVRTISHNLLPQKKIKQNFSENINQLVLLYQSEKLKIDVDIFPEKEINKLSQKIEIELNRILQELITNIIKHAKATKCAISIVLHDNYLNVIIEDDGIGYDTNQKNKGIGLNNITSRIKSINGTLDIDSLQGKGTTVNINIPVN